MSSLRLPRPGVELGPLASEASVLYPTTCSHLTISLTLCQTEQSHCPTLCSNISTPAIALRLYRTLGLLVWYVIVLTVYLKQLVTALAAPMQVHSCVQEVRSIPGADKLDSGLHASGYAK